MASTVFIDYTTPIVAAWLNDVNTVAYTTVPAILSALALRVSKTSDTGSVILPSGTTAQRDGSPVGGYFRYNNSVTKLEFWNGVSWVQLADTGSFLSTSGGTLTGLLKLATGTSIPSSATVDLSAATGNTVHITGSTGITAWTLSNGQVMDVIFDGSLVLTHHTTNNNLPGGLNITTAVNDRARIFYDGTTVYILNYTRADGSTSRMTMTATVATTSGTSIDLTGLPSWAKEIAINFNGISTNGTSPVQVQLGHSGGVTTSGYLGSVGAYANGTPSCANLSAGITTETTGAAAALTVRQGTITVYLSGTSSWAFSSRIGQSNGPTIAEANGTVTLAGVLDRIRLTTVNGTDTFDAGSISLLIKG